MRLRPIVAVAAMIFSLFAVAALSAQDADQSDNVLEQARQKYQADLDQREKEAETKTANQDLVITIQVPQSSAPASTAAENPVEPFSIQFVPGLPWDSSHKKVGLALGVLLDSVGEVDGFQAAGIGNLSNGQVRGFQAAGIFNVASGPVTGGQSAGIFNVADGEVRFFQGAGVFNVAGDVAGFQGAGVLNVGGNIRGLQAAGVVNVASDVTGVQVSGVVNIARHVRGLQLGLVNISDTMDGLAIGLINISKNGINEQVFWSDDKGFGYGGFQFGTKGVYALFYGGARKNDLANSEFWNSATLGGSLGYRLKLGPFFVQADAGIKAHVFPLGDSAAWEPFGNVRLSGGVKFWGPVGVFAGVNADLDSGSWWSMPSIYRSDWGGTIIDGKLYSHLSWFFGLSL